MGHCLGWEWADSNRPDRVPVPDSWRIHEIQHRRSGRESISDEKLRAAAWTKPNQTMNALKQIVSIQTALARFSPDRSQTLGRG